MNIPAICNHAPLNPTWKSGYRAGIQSEFYGFGLPDSIYRKSEYYKAGFRYGMKARQIRAHNNWASLGVAS